MHPCCILAAVLAADVCSECLEIVGAMAFMHV
jgi:hypothetical protein